MATKQLTADELKTKINKLNTEITTLQTTIAPLQKKLMSKWKTVEKAQEQLSSFVVVDMATKSIDEQLEYALPENGNSSDMVKHGFEQDLARSLGFYSSGYNPNTNQRSWRIMLTKGSQESYDKTLKGLKLLIPHLKYSKIAYKDNNYNTVEMLGITISIFEHSLSKHGVYDLTIFETGNTPYAIIKTYRSSRSISKSFATLEESVKYIQEHLWYDGGEEEEESENW